jgi:4-carboxymuconolactone decarboxylase
LKSFVATNQTLENPMKTLLASSTLCLAALMPAQAQTDAAASGASLNISRNGSRVVNPGPAQNFSGAVRVEMLQGAEAPSRASVGSVSFMPGARTAWHTHPLGQTLVVTAGVGRVQRWGGPVETIRVGDVVRIPPGVKHWHGAAPDSAMTHIAVQEAVDGRTADWLEKVAEDTPAAPTAAPAAAQPSRAQQLMGDIAPKLAQLTDDVLFGDIWARPGLSRRDRSLATVSALIAMNRPDQLRSHLALARENGVTEAELVEAITHLAFYAGWPSGVTAAGVAKEVFKKP